MTSMITNEGPHAMEYMYYLREYVKGEDVLVDSDKLHQSMAQGDSRNYSSYVASTTVVILEVQSGSLTLSAFVKGSGKEKESLV
jgi:hypothetical protein